MLLAVARMRGLSQKLGRALARERGERSKEGYLRWVDEQLRLGAGALHRLCKPQDIADDHMTLSKEGDWGYDIEEALEKEVNTWAGIWERYPDAQAPWRTEGCPEGPQLPPITAAALRTAACGFALKKGFTGGRGRWFKHLSDPALEAVGIFLGHCERFGCWPSAVRRAILHLTPKRDEGRRPIGLVDGLCRLWEKVRKPQVQA